MDQTGPTDLDSVQVFDYASLPVHVHAILCDAVMEPQPILITLIGISNFDEVVAF